MSDKNRVNNSGSEKSDEIDLGRLLGELIDNRWLIIGVTALSLTLGILYCLFATPIYRADAMVQVEQNVGNALLNNINQILPNGQPESGPEIELLKSRMILNKTVEDLNLRTIVEQEYFPLFGKGFARLTKKVPGKIAVSKFDLPEAWAEDPSVTLVVGDGKSFSILRDGEEIAKGSVGRLLDNNGVTILVSNIEAPQGTKFKVSKISEMRATNNLLDKFEVADKGKNTGVLGLGLTGENPVLIREILDSISRNYLEQNIVRKSEEDAKSLDFLRDQLPKIRNSLDSAENKLNQYRQQKDSVDLSLEAKSVLDSIVAVDSQLNELTFKEAEISKLYTKQHPSYRALLEKRKTLENDRDRLNKRVSAMPKTQQEIVRLSRDVQSGQEVYMQLLNKEQELGISKASTVGNVRIIDRAITQSKPVEPKSIIVILFSIVLGGVLSVGYVLLRSFLHRGIENPEQLEELGINVYASVPLSEWQQKKDQEFVLKNKGRKLNSDSNSLLAVGNPADLAIEAIRSLRTSLHFAMMEAKNNVLMISGASPGIGKTFISANLAAVVAQAGQRVLFIDSDMRKGYMHEVLGLEAKDGLSDILSGRITATSAVRSTVHGGFAFIPRGQIPPNPSELLMHSRFSEVLAWASENYDLVLVDTPPILAVTDAAIIGKHAGTSLMVARFELNSPKEVEVSIRRFEQNGIDIKGVILNAVMKKASNYYNYGYDYYEYSYKSKS
ncbi:MULTISPECIES: tyrosine-protein kinase Wzc [Serratia]|jgi:tyrosine-protein kinase Etk/Wzc|uniref:Tyrosine-protein kinase Wzc n=1 Tax=Serratia marcescens TaxID=615 RepID=A0ABD5IPL0_SERMA|nr:MULTISPECIES: tyrosine-protein kinase Wzc [Serratia]ASL86959.1 tyrosine-protein kinase [Serratia marcescens]EIG9086089.1 tyrosine-protein kinase Wzc [Serratia marcescens]MBH3001220.1 tyrosine-protein kinase Wzc [Serratia marcescens]MBH3194403.1 tyrosine-protein kinase Wzc [Serratia marcescens]MBH3197656.1 tyrosine-protein kinase Wzc [Serratia marcescens]